LDPEAVEGVLLPAQVAELVETGRDRAKVPEAVRGFSQTLADRMRAHYHGRLCNILLDASSGNTAQLWDNSRILSPTTHCIVFGFGSEFVMLDKHLIQTSGLNLLMTRGVGNLRNRREVVELIKAGASNFVDRFLVRHARPLGSLDEAIAFVREQHEPPKPLHRIPHAYMTPNRL
jgi:threonine dehydrogenase-like Zn-dependent dehydrogenase